MVGIQDWQMILTPQAIARFDLLSCHVLIKGD
jgi:hypothetical protein